MRSRPMSFLLPAIALLCACILPAGASAQPVPAISPPTAVQPMVVGVDLGAQDATVLSTFNLHSAVAQIEGRKNFLTMETFLVLRDAFSCTADARVPTVPGVTVGGGSLA